MSHKKTIESGLNYWWHNVITLEEYRNIIQFYTTDENHNWVIRKLSADA